MSYATWDWTKETGTGNPSGLDLTRVSPRLVHETDAGYQAMGAMWTKDRWRIEIEFSIIRPIGWLYLVQLFHDHRGGLPFYWRYPYGIAGIPEYAYTSDPGGVEPWSSEDEPGAGEAPKWIVRFNQDELPLRRRRMPNNFFATKIPIELVSL